MHKNNFNLEKLNTFQIKCSASQYFKFDDANKLDSYVRDHFKGVDNWLILGGGSNILLASDYNSIVIHPVNESIEVLQQMDNKIVVRAYAGLEWDSFVSYALQQGWNGLENLTLIPGNVGAAPVQNIGAYGTEVSEIISKVNCYNLKTNEFISLDNIECEFSYRKSIFKLKSELVVLSVDFIFFVKPFSKIFENGRKKAISQGVQQFFIAILLILKSIKLNHSTSWKLKMNFEYVRQFLSLTVIHPSLKRAIVKKIRTKTMPDPKVIGNVGCFFKSPIVSIEQFNKIKYIDASISCYRFDSNRVKVSAGDLIKSCEWNGKRVGDVSVEVNRPLIILNHGNASGQDILNFSIAIQDDIFTKFNIKLEPEVVILGNEI